MMIIIVVKASQPINNQPDRHAAHDCNKPSGLNNGREFTNLRIAEMDTHTFMHDWRSYAQLGELRIIRLFSKEI